MKSYYKNIKYNSKHLIPLFRKIRITAIIGIMLLFVSGCSMGIRAEQQDGSSEVPILET